MTLSFTTKLFIFLITLLLVTGGLYAFFLNKTVMNIVARKDLEQEISFMNSSISELEVRYIKLKNTVTFGRAQAEGFTALGGTQYIDARDTHLTLDRPTY